MNALLPGRYAADAVPENRTVDEEQLPPAATQTNELFRRVEEQAKYKEGTQKEQSSSAAGPSKPPKDEKAKDSKRTRSAREKKIGSDRKNAFQGVNIVHISGSSNIQVGPRVENHITLVSGASSSRTTPKETTPEPSQQPNLPKKLFYSLKHVTKEDCVLVSEHVSCKWDELGDLLFFEEKRRLEQYRVEMEKHDKKKAVRMILEEWRKVSNNPLIARLSEVLSKLNEIDALKKLAKRHSMT